MNKLVGTKGTILTADTALYAGTITSGVAADFVQFTQVYKDIIKINDILKDPANCPMPMDSQIQWATISSMMEHVTADNIQKLATYANRFDLAFRILFFRSVLIRHPKLRSSAPMADAFSTLSKYLHG